MPTRRWIVVAALLAGSAAVSGAPDLPALERQVADAERAFARSMAERRLDDFARHVSEQAVFYGGPQPLRGKAAVLADWKPLFDAAQAPFSWAPERVDVLADGTLAFSSGLVRGPDGKPLQRFNSVWRLEEGAVWRVVFDKGTPLTEADARAAER